MTCYHKRMLLLLALLVLLLVAIPSWAQQPAFKEVVLQNAASGTGNGTPVDVLHYTGASLEVAFTGSATVTFEGSVSGGRWGSTACNDASSTSGAQVTATTASGVYHCSLTGLTKFRARVSNYGTGTVTVYGRLSVITISRKIVPGEAATGAPTDAVYWTGAAHNGLTSEVNLAAQETGLVINTGGAPSAYLGTTCTSKFLRALSGLGVGTCEDVVAADFGSQTANFVLVAPSGVPGDPTFRGLVDADVPNDITISLAATASALAANGGNCAGNEFALGVTAAGVGECAQPAFSNLSGSATDAQIPNTITVDLATLATSATTAAALSANGGNCSGNNFAVGVDASGVGECAQPAFSNLSGSATDAQVPNTITIDLAAAATALAANGGNCAGNNFAVGVDASGVGECAQPAFSNLSGSATDAQIPNTITVDLATSAATAVALATNGGNCGGNNFALGVDASGVGECAQPDFSNLSGSATTAQIGDDQVTYAKMQNVSATSRFLGRITASAGDTEELTGTQATTLLDTFTSSLNGLAPLSGGGTYKYLRADGTWVTPPNSILQDEGVTVTSSTKINFSGDGVSCVLDAYSVIVCTIPGNVKSLVKSNALLVAASRDASCRRVLCAPRKGGLP